MHPLRASISTTEQDLSMGLVHPSSSRYGLSKSGLRLGGCKRACLSEFGTRRFKMSRFVKTTVAQTHVHQEIVLGHPWTKTRKRKWIVEAPKWLIPLSNCSCNTPITVNYHVNQDGGSTVSLAAAFGAFDALLRCRTSLGAAAVVDAAGRGCWSSVGSATPSHRIERQAEAFPRFCRLYVVVSASVSRRRTPRRQRDRGKSDVRNQSYRSLLSVEPEIESPIKVGGDRSASASRSSPVDRLEPRSRAPMLRRTNAMVMPRLRSKGLRPSEGNPPTLHTNDKIDRWCRNKCSLPL
jgi:hypothetical protein